MSKNKMSKKRMYSEEMRYLSFLTYDELLAHAVRWEVMDYDTEIVEKYGLENFAKIPPATAMRINSLKQVLESLEDNVARIEWANRIEGKPMQTTVNLNHETTSIEELERYTTDKLDKLFEGL